MELGAEVSKLSQRRKRRKRWKAEAGVSQGTERTICADAAKVGILHFGVLLPPTCSSSVSHLYHASQVKNAFEKGMRLCVFSRSSCSKPPLLSVTRCVLGIETFFKMG